MTLKLSKRQKRLAAVAAKKNGHVVEKPQVRRMLINPEARGFITRPQWSFSFEAGDLVSFKDCAGVTQVGMVTEVCNHNFRVMYNGVLGVFSGSKLRKAD